MSKQIVMSRRGKPVGHIDTARDGMQRAVCPQGSVLGLYDPRVGETLTPAGVLMSDGNLLTDLLLRR